jgi:uncharacterized membrane-anchored protein YhcB (DUF1043 family)
LSLLDTPSHREEVDSRLADARERLLALRRQQEELERQKNELEELRRKQDEYTRGKAEMVDNLTRGLVTLEREQIAAQRRVELCTQTAGAFRGYLEQLQAIDDTRWNSDNLRPELSRALGVIENARLEFNRARTKLDCLNPAATESPAESPAAGQGVSRRELIRYALLGAAASAPLILAGTIWLIVALLAR